MPATALSSPNSIATATVTEDEFLRWYADQEFGKAEWVGGKIIMMMSVSGAHDDICFLVRSLLQFFVERRNLGKVRGPQFPMRLGDRRREPDVLFVAADRIHLLLPNHLEGPPDLAVEVVSPESESRDWREKYLEYEASGVREYWILDPLSKVVEAYALSNKGTYVQIPEIDSKLMSTVIPGWFLRPAWLWQEPRASVLDLLIELGVK